MATHVSCVTWGVPRGRLPVPCTVLRSVGRDARKSRLAMHGVTLLRDLWGSRYRAYPAPHTTRLSHSRGLP